MYSGLVVWTGAQRTTPGSASSFVWRPNNTTTLPMQYLSWMNYQPDNHFGNESCVDLVEAGSYNWNDENCNVKTCVLCEYGPLQK